VSPRGGCWAAAASASGRPAATARQRANHLRHIHLRWPVWNVLDLTPEGRGTDWYPALS